MIPRAGPAIFSINCFLAAMLAAYIAFSIGLPRPYWAMLTVYITSQPLTGALRSKAVYRVIGTVLGGIAAVVIVPTFVNAPVLLSLVMAGWVGLCLYLSLLDRTPRAYVFMLAGYTAAIIGLPSVGAPQAIFETGLARVEEITLGIMCATFVHTILFPRDVGQVLGVRIAGFLKDSQQWVAEALTLGRSEAERGERRRLAADITELHIAATHLPFDTSNLPIRVATVRALENRLAYVLPVISALEDRLGQLGQPPEDLQRLLADTVAWAQAKPEAGDEPTAAALQARCRELMPVLGPQADWPNLLVVNILLRLEELIQALQDSRDLAAMVEGIRLAPERTRALLRAAPRRRLHLDHGMAALSALALVAAVLICCTAWIATAWPEGYVAAMMAAVFSSFYAAQDDPAPGIRSFLVWTALAIPPTAVYLFMILPVIDGFPMLALVLAPALLAIGYFQATPRFASPALAVLLGFVGGLALQPNFAADLPEFLNANLSECVGIGVALACAQLMRSVGAGWAARRILRRAWRDIVGLARSRRRIDADAWSGAMLDRVGLVTTRVALSDPDEGLDAHDVLADMRVGLNLIELNALASRSRGGEAQAVHAVSEAVAQMFEQRLADPRRPADPRVLEAIDSAVADLAAEGDTDPRQAGLAALVGLRRNLFPGAGPYQARAA